MTEEERWKAVAARDARFDGAFVYAVRSTGVFCRPACSSRRPRRDQVLFFEGAAAAAAAGFRPCRRCRPELRTRPDPARELVKRVCAHIDSAPEEKPTLEALGAVVDRSPFYLQRVFKRVMGITPQQYTSQRRLERLKGLLKGGDQVTGALYEAGYGSSSRLYERAPSELGMTPAAYRRGGEGVRIRYALAPCSLGRVLVAATERGIAFVGFGERDRELVRALEEEYPGAGFVPNDAALGHELARVAAALDGGASTLDLPLDVRATAFERRVYQELRAIPAGETRTYGEIAASIGRPGAARAVGSACAKNPVSLVVPCHRVVRSDGGLGGYRWGIARKKALIARERSRRESSGTPAAAEARAGAR
ncbi:MAG: bifunctional DNA-binding transcriptional regulator/O6-methylguanine-DNA methyltransferase Ada [Alphaproteobacteria bacterium]